MTDKQLQQQFKVLEQNIERRVERIVDTKLDMFAVQMFAEFTKLRREMDDRFDGVDKKFSVLQSAVDGIAKGLEDERLERTALASKVNRHDGWIKTIASNTNTNLA